MSRRLSLSWSWVKTAIIAVCAGILALGASAHDIPTDVKINVFFKPAGERLSVLIRMPLAATIEVEYPICGAGYLDLSRAGEALRAAAKMYLADNITVYEDGLPLAPPRIAETVVSLPSDKSFASYEQALAHLHGPRLPDNLELYWNQQSLDVLLEYPIRSDRSRFAIHPRVDRFGVRVSTALRFLAPSGVIRAFRLDGDPGVVDLDPGWQQAALRFVAAGFFHILGGPDHLLFVLCLVIPFRRLRPLVIIVTSFTVAHSISLIASAFGFVPDALWFPPLIETLIAATILYTALENIVLASLGANNGSAIARRWIIAFVFGLVHGFAFSFALRESFQFAGDHLVTALLGFNLGVEIGQLAVLLVLIPALDLLFRYVLPERLGIIILSAIVAHTAWHWLLERADELAKFPFPRIDAALLASAMRGMIALLALGAGAVLLNALLKRLVDPRSLSLERDNAGAPFKKRSWPGRS